MSSKDEAARILDEGLPAELPGWDLTDDFLEDVGGFLDTSLHDPIPGSGVEAVSQTPAYSAADQTGLTETQLDNSLSPPVSTDLASDLSHTQRRLHSNRLAQARARQRKKVGSCCWAQLKLKCASLLLQCTFMLSHPGPGRQHAVTTCRNHSAAQSSEVAANAA